MFCKPRRHKNLSIHRYRPGSGSFRRLPDQQTFCSPSLNPCINHLLCRYDRYLLDVFFTSRYANYSLALFASSASALSSILKMALPQALCSFASSSALGTASSPMYTSL
ncbi:predicted protein [Plenodomus lingam JN3]|uniref:Predicted protein n=1 Tax=Leptosphaeria maculans (strain JN3 / isolate v23.1.3 / race Av1-4-5-6-7-8) TaxID=985895 RepID=E4ZTM4_LEPMJ|nr:predicted protein [Plenodomus lingam JN3]CBX94880.1 predicted protein [Plenodomus lingam JN3]